MLTQVMKTFWPQSASKLIAVVWHEFAILVATTQIELKRRYAGSLFGTVWVALYPLLFLSVYLFLYSVVFKVQYPELNTLGSVIYIFTGLIPYLAFMDSCNMGCTSIKQNVHLVKNVILPVELIPLRIVTMTFVTQFIGLGIIMLLAIFNHNLSAHLLLLPLALLLQLLTLFGLVLLLSPLGLLLPDVSYFVNILTLLLLFISPIGFMAVMLPSHLRFLVHYNPIYYYIEPFRMVFLPTETLSVSTLLISVAQSLLLFISGAALFNRFKEVVAEYE